MSGAFVHEPNRDEAPAGEGFNSSHSACKDAAVFLFLTGLTAAWKYYKTFLFSLSD